MPLLDPNLSAGSRHGGRLSSIRGLIFLQFAQNDLTTASLNKAKGPFIQSWTDSLGWPNLWVKGLVEIKDMKLVALRRLARNPFEY
jgi:hypothetical protein